MKKFYQKVLYLKGLQYDHFKINFVIKYGKDIYRPIQSFLY